MKKYAPILIIIFFLIPVHNLVAQNEQLSTRSIQDSLILLKRHFNQMERQHRIEIARFDSLISTLIREKDQESKEENLKQLLDEANQLTSREKEKEVDLSKRFQTGIRQQQGLNPNISLGGDFFGALSSSKNDYITDPGDILYGNNGFYLREAELALEAPLDPFSRGKTYISITKEDISIEEAYVEWLNLPLKMNLKIGIFYVEFGPLNRYHDHALPQFDRPRALVNLFSNKGLSGTGLSSNFMLPKVLFADASSFDLSIVNGGNDFSFEERRKAGMLYVGQFKNYYDINQNSYFEIRLSGVTGKNPSPFELRSYVGSLGLTYKWAPIGREKYRTLDWKTEFLYSYREENFGTIKSKGFYSSVQNKLNAKFWLGARIGYSELPSDQTQYEWDYTINLDFWQSEFVFTRIQYQYNQRNTYSPYTYELLPDDHSIIIQVCWSMGPHKHEAY
jgi:hypothetical protein